MASGSRSGPTTVLLIVAAMLAGLVGAVPVWSQTQQVVAQHTTEAIPTDDPWNEIWSRVRPEIIPLSTQNLVPPFGGGTVTAVDVRALHDDGRLYLHLEWPDATMDDGVAGVTEFSDAAAVQFPIVAGAPTPYTMGGPGTPVNIWHWKAVWQSDLAGGFEGTSDRYPDTYVDLYPYPDDPLYRPAEHTGNPLAQREHPSPIENLAAEGFGTLTTAEVQDVDGAGAWRDGTWRALFVRALAPAGEGMATFGVDSSTLVAFAIWDGDSQDRNGQKSIAQFVDLSLTGVELAEPEAGLGLWGALLVAALVIGFTIRLATLGRRGPDGAAPAR